MVFNYDAATDKAANISFIIIFIFQFGCNKFCVALAFVSYKK